MRAEADAVLEAARAGTWVVHRRDLAPRAEVGAAPPDGLARPVLDALRQAGIARLWSHQSEALRRVLSGRHALVVTPTASGCPSRAWPRRRSASPRGAMGYRACAGWRKDGGI